MTIKYRRINGRTWAVRYDKHGRVDGMTLARDKEWLDHLERHI